MNDTEKLQQLTDQLKLEQQRLATLTQQQLAELRKVEKLALVLHCQVTEMINVLLGTNR